MSGTRSSGRKLQHNDKVLEHNGLSSAQTEARTSLAPKGQQASRSSCSAAPLLLFAILITLRWPLCCKCGSHPEIPSKHENAIGGGRGGGCLFWKTNIFLTSFPRAWSRLGWDSVSIRDLWSGANLADICSQQPDSCHGGERDCETKCFQRAKHGSAAKGRFRIHEAT